MLDLLRLCTGALSSCGGQGPLWLRAQASYYSGFSCAQARLAFRAAVAAALRLSSTGSAVVVPGQFPLWHVRSSQTGVRLGLELAFIGLMKEDHFPVSQLCRTSPSFQELDEKQIVGRNCDCFSYNYFTKLQGLVEDKC